MDKKKKISKSKGFELDENGKLILKPLYQVFNFVDKPARSENASQPQKRDPPKYTLQPLRFSGFSSDKPKKMKVDSEGCRKKLLFKVPLTTQQKRNSKVKSRGLFDSPALLDVSEVEHRLIDNKERISSIDSIMNNSARQHNITITNDIAVEIQINDNNFIKVAPAQKRKSSSSSSDNSPRTMEYLRIEQQCASPLNTNNTSNCSITTDSSLLHQKLNEIRSILDQDQQNFELYARKRALNVASINEILNNVENSNKLIGDKMNGKTTTDLRKSVLLQTPRSKKALKLYNSVKSDFNMLSTPCHNRIDRLSPSSAGNTGDCSSRNKLLSQTIHQQCLMLQETPNK